MHRIIRPFWVVGMTWALVCLIGVWLSSTVLYAALGVAAIALIVAFCVPRLRRHHGLLAVLVATIPAVGLILYSTNVYDQAVAPLMGKEIHLHVEVQANEEITELKVLSGDLAEGTRVRLLGEPMGAALDPGDTFGSVFVLQPMESEGLAFHQARASGVYLNVMLTDLSGEGLDVKSGDYTESVFASWRREIVWRIQTILTGDVGATVSGICLGADERLSYEAVSGFRACGVSHLFAVSGLHLSLITQALLLFLKRIRVPRRVRGGICAAAVLLFSALVGWTPSVVRAGVVCLVVVIGDCFRRQADARNSLGLALLILLIGDPFAVYDVGLLLSFSATFGLLFVAPAIQRKLGGISVPERLSRVWRYAASGISVTLAATLATLPITVLFFGRASVVSIVANLLMTIPASLVLILAWVAILTMPFGLALLYRPLLLVVGYLAKLLLWLSSVIAELPFATVSLADTYRIVGVLGGLVIVCVAYRLLQWRGVRWSVLLCGIALCIGGGLHQYRMHDISCFYPSAVVNDTLVCIVYKHYTVLIIDPTEVNTVQAARSLLSEADVSSLDAIVMPSGEQPNALFIPSVLNEYYDDATVYNGEIDLVLGDARLTSREGWLYWEHGDGMVAFDFGGKPRDLSERTDVVFSTEPSAAVLEFPLTVVQGASPYPE